jgi:GMP synthase-like glutamine amidotransferase
MNVLIVQHVDMDGPGSIRTQLRDNGIPYRVLTLERNEPFPKLDDLTHVILLGGPMNVYEEDAYSFLKQEDLFVKEAIQRGKQILGICLGSQLIAKALGARVYRAPVKEIGWYGLSLTDEGRRDRIFSDLPGAFPVFQWHEDTFDLPKAAKLIATSDPVSNQAFRYGDNAYGLQFHPEVTEEMIRDWMKEYEGEFEAGSRSRFSREQVLRDTELKWKGYSELGQTLMARFLNLG